MNFLVKQNKVHYTIVMYYFGLKLHLIGVRAAEALRKSDRGVTAIEYALIALLIAIPIVGGLFAIGGRLNAIFSNVNNGFSPS